MSQQPSGNVRGTPKFAAFLVTGGLVGLLTGLSLGVFGEPDPRYGATAALGFLGLICSGLGILAGGLVAVLLDRRT